MTTMGKEASLDGLEFDGDTVLCRVCGDKASGFHYGVHACEGCKGFFRRSIQQKIQYRPCLKNQQCNIMRVNRNRCQYCRLKKCIAVGMSRDAVRFGRVPKKEKARIIEQMQKMNSQTPNHQLTGVLQNPLDLVQHVINAHRQTCAFTLDRVKSMRQAAVQKGEFVNCPAQMACPLNANLATDPNDNCWEDFSEFFSPAIKSVVDFAKAIPGFALLNPDDQVTLLKASTFEVLLVRLAALFDPDTNTMLFTCGKLFKRQPTTVTTSAGFLLDSMFDFAERFNKLNLTDDEIALFSAVVLLSPDRPGLRNLEQIEKVQTKLTESLQSIINTNHMHDNTLFAKLLMKTTDLRTLNTLHSEKSIGQACQGVEGYENDHGELKTNLQEAVDSRSEGSSPSETSFNASGYDPSVEVSGAPVLTHRVPMDMQGHQQQVVLKTPYGTFYREESFYGLVPDPPRRRCHTLDRETVSRPRLHTIEEGSRRRNTLDRDYINKMVNKLSDKLEKRAAIHGDSMPPSICNSAASSPIPEEYQHYLNRNHEFIPISTPADSSACSSRASPQMNRDLLMSRETVMNCDTLLPYGSSPSSPNPRSRSGSMGADDFGNRRRCYSFHMNSEGRASRGNTQQQQVPINYQMEQERLTSEDFNNTLMPDMRRGSVGASYNLHARKKSLLVDRHPAYLSRLSDSIKKKTEQRHLMADLTTSTQAIHMGEDNSAFDSVSSIRIPVPCTPQQWPNPTATTSQHSDRSSDDTKPKDNVEEPSSPMVVDQSEEENPPVEMFHKKFDKLRKHMIQTTEDGSEPPGDVPQPIVIEDPPNKLELPKSPKLQKQKLSAGEAHPQLLAHLQSPNRAGLVNVPLPLGSQGLGALPSGAFLNNNGLAAALSRPPDISAPSSEMSSRGNQKEQLHATTMFHLKDKLMRKYDSMENLHKIGQNPGGQNPGQPSENDSSNETNHNPSTTESQSNKSMPGFQGHIPINSQGQAPGMMGPAMYPSAMHPAFIGAAYSSMHSMMPGYNQHLAGMQQLAQFYGQGPQVRFSPDGQPLNLTQGPPSSAALGASRGANSLSLEQAMERKIKEEVSS